MNFDLILDFLRTYYKEIVEISVLIISVVICLIKKRPGVNEMDSIKKDVLERLPMFIALVESPGNGAQKKQQVLDLLSCYVRKIYHVDLTDDLFLFFGDRIEDILSTPKKKGE